MFILPMNYRGRTLALVALAFLCLWASPLLAQEASTEAQIDELLSKLDRGESIENLSVNLRDINFQFNSSELTPASHSYLDKVVRFMEQVPNLKLEINGHTDNMGDPAYNLKLSEARAGSVRRYLASQGADTARIQSQGFGMEQPLESNADAAGRAKNRRVEFVVIRTEAVQTIQDLIVLTTGDTIGAKVLSATEAGVRYRTFRDDEEKFLNPGLVDKVIFADGRVWPEEQPVVDTPVVQRQRRSSNKSFDLDLGDLGEIFEQSEVFESGTDLFWVDYQIRSTAGEREFRTRTTLPTLGLNYERQLIYNIGLRTYLSTHWWEEDRPLARAGSELYTELFTYQYWTLGAGFTWHANAGERWDPYVGFMYNYRWAKASCECVEESLSLSTGNLFFGTRFLITPAFFLLAEVGQHGTGTFHFGMGLDL